ncbi:MAG: restriction endonuclease subunit S, partial [Chloroflexota bacterium]
MSSQSNDIPEGFKMTELGLLPEDWAVTSFGELSKEITIKNGFPEGGHNLEGLGVPHLRPFNITNDGGIDLTQIKYVPRPMGGSPYWVHKADIIFNNTNSEELVGKTAYFSLDGDFVLSNHMTLLRVNPQGHLDGRWLAYFMRYLYWTGVMHAASRRYVNQAAVTLARLYSIKLPLPPLPEQKAIAEVLSTIQRAIETQDKIIAAARELKKSLMRHLFTYGPVSVAEAEKVSLKETEIG